MSISGISNNTGYNFSNYQTTGSYNSKTSTSASSQQTQQVNGRPEGPPPPKGGGGKGGQMKGPELDTDSDGLWSTDELDDFASYASSELGITIDTESIMNTYDTNGDGTISSEERLALGRDNAFNLPSPKDMMQQMKGFQQGPRIQNVSNDGTSTSDTNKETSLQMIQQLIQAYSQQNDSIYDELKSSSSVTYQV